MPGCIWKDCDKFFSGVIYISDASTVLIRYLFTSCFEHRPALRTPVARHVLTAVTAALTHASTASTVVVVLPALPSVLPLCLFTVTG